MSLHLRGHTFHQPYLLPKEATMRAAWLTAQLLLLPLGTTALLRITALLGTRATRGWGATAKRG